MSDYEGLEVGLDEQAMLAVEELRPVVEAVEPLLPEIEAVVAAPPPIEGPQGPPGPPGADGKDGAAGPPGADGEVGAPGATGPAGPQGPKGDTGNTGPAGAASTVPGPQGPPGQDGAAGPPGPIGNTGPAGPQGQQGIKGDTGNTGAQGPQGIPGTPGSQGIQGVQGPPGLGVVLARLTADHAPFTSTTLANVTGIAAPVAANQTLDVEFAIPFTSAALTTGWQFGLTGPAGCAILAICEYQASATTWATATLQALGAFPLTTAAYVAAPSLILARIRVFVSNAANAGSLQLQCRTEVAASAIVVKRGCDVTAI